MAVEVAVPSEIAYVAVVVVVTFFINAWFGTKVVAARARFNVKYPTMYAVESENKDAKAFNCVQRGHQNFLEIVPIFLALSTFAGLQHPRLAAIFGLLFLVARVVYFLDYSTGDPKKRMRGAIGGYACIWMLIGLNISFAVRQLLL